MTSFFIQLIIMLTSFGSLQSERILFLFPLPFISHYRAFSPVIEELAGRGHEITAYTSEHCKQKSPSPNLKEITVHLGPEAPDLRAYDVVELGTRTNFENIFNDWHILSSVTEAALQSAALQELMTSSEKFDLVIVEATLAQESLLAFGHKFGAPVINLHPNHISPFVALMMGTSHSMSFMPNYRLPYTNRMNFWQRTHNALLGIFEASAGSLYYIPYQERIMRRNFKYSGSDSLPPLSELLANVSLHLVDSHQMMYARPQSPNVIDVAGMNRKLTGQLPSDIKKFMDEAAEGFIYFSLGSFIEPKIFNEHVQRVFMETMKIVKYRVIWRHSEAIDGEPKHILNKMWLPQGEILAHPNCKIFITHGGYNSLVEAMNSGVPVLGLPVFADQPHNVAYYEHMGVGLGADVHSLTVEEFSEKIDRIITTPSFRDNAKRMAEIYRDMPRTSLEEAVFWVEYVMRHNGAHHLKPASVSMPLYKYLLLDVIAFLSLCMGILMYILCKCLTVAQQKIKSRIFKKRLANKQG